MATELPYRGRLIVQKPYKSQFDCMGFDVPVVYHVLDPDFGDNALPTLQDKWWSPLDAIQAINFCDLIMPDMKGPKWPTTAIHEYNIMLCYHRNFDHVFHTIQKIKKACRDSRDFDDNPRDEIERLLAHLYSYCLEQKRTLG